MHWTLAVLLLLQQATTTTKTTANGTCVCGTHTHSLKGAHTLAHSDSYTPQKDVVIAPWQRLTQTTTTSTSSGAGADADVGVAWLNVKTIKSNSNKGRVKATKKQQKQKQKHQQQWDGSNSFWYFCRDVAVILSCVVVLLLLLPFSLLPFDLDSWSRA